MRIVIDMQGAQTESRFRGIGRYAMEFAKAVVRNRGEHEVYLALSSFLPETIASIRRAFDDLLPQANIRVWHAPTSVHASNSRNTHRAHAAELIREAFLDSLEPDVVHVTSLFEGFGDDAVISLGRLNTRGISSVTLFDLIPLVSPEKYLDINPLYATYYRRQIGFLKQAQVFLAISEFSKNEARETLQIAPELITNTLLGVDDSFHLVDTQTPEAQLLRQRLGLQHPFVLYTGGGDERKNLPALLRAWAELPTAVREQHQLVLAGRMPEAIARGLHDLATELKLPEKQLLISGYVSHDELVLLYNLCKLFVFPSWHEGFGLPVAEAMACGSPVIGSNTTSLPEVIGLAEALFNPFDVGSMRSRLQQALTDEKYLGRLREHSHVQVKKFDWNVTAAKAIKAWENALGTSRGVPLQQLTAPWQDMWKPLVATLRSSPLDFSCDELIGLSHDIAQSSLNGMERQLFVDVSELYHNDAATGVQRVVRAYLNQLLNNPPKGFRVEPVFATLEHGYCYARNFAARFIGQALAARLDDAPIQFKRGDLFFGLDMQHHVQLKHASFFDRLRQQSVTVKFLVYDLLAIQLPHCFADPHASQLHENLLRLIARQDEAICISKATADSLNEWIEAKEIETSTKFRTSWVHIGADLEGSQPSSGIPSSANAVYSALASRPTFLVVSTIEPRKAQDQVLSAVELLWQQGVDCNLVLVGKQGWKVEQLVDRLGRHVESQHRLFWLKGISDEYLAQIYQRSSCLIISSLNEGFGLPLIEAARAGIPVIARDIPVFHEIAGENASYFHGQTAQALANTMHDWLTGSEQGQYIASDGMRWLTWAQSAERLKKALTHENYNPRQLLVDVSELVRVDARSGIQRVVRSVLQQWLSNPPPGFNVLPVKASLEEGYRYARTFTASFLGCSSTNQVDEIVEYSAGDIFFGLDFHPQIVVSNAAIYQRMRDDGVAVKFLIYDLLSITMPQFFPPGASDAFLAWLNVVVRSNEMICISKTVADELSKWVEERVIDSDEYMPIINWAHIGADIDNSIPSIGLPEGAGQILSKLNNSLSFLMVGTLEPRKGHLQMLDVFDQLWAVGTDANLVIVGKSGWLTDQLIARIKGHDRLGERLFWLQSISDEYLEKIYAACNCLIAASYGEGFGLPLIEAAQHNLPIVARDIPVFREVAGINAEYFSDSGVDSLAIFFREWMERYKKNEHVSVEEMPWLSWAKSSEILLKKVIN
ncbi:glycosyltransferase family 4 protein [Diaphorobacter caeni]|uniref:glycosyltransferase family 4 protein n=1 Tax=Diaphorobacter caeni TaxID=2784387 RepID=UPI001890A0BF|nr:glycosyltransferase family 1 protein [Diaphorobacter caeni]MBF5003877.1 glycosyltransferase family 4 protein [Diaphorobacter caeni]